MECIDGIILPIEPAFVEPIEKVKWLTDYLSECQDAKSKHRKNWAGSGTHDARAANLVAWAVDVDFRKAWAFNFARATNVNFSTLKPLAGRPSVVRFLLLVLF
ncbi:hypothetical protein VIGAN_03165400 [Vigna angularis var. angularis]|uniref:Uncharacterized protein n=1 Tax=Vigna angularis var. angularis TaxID=157739 RepID=A0A0S3RMG0_PHAAN|nr:hypothetical protein VIGAN_03165400 [Vigna angularis var. angularis]